MKHSLYLSQEAILQPQPYVESAATQAQTHDLYLVPDLDGSEILATSQLARPRAPLNCPCYLWQNTVDEYQQMFPRFRHNSDKRHDQV